MKELIKKSFLEESETLLNSEMVTLVGGSGSLTDPPVYPACQSSCVNGCTKSCMTSCSVRKSS